MSIGSCWLFGFILCIVIAACMNPDASTLLGSSFGQPMAQIYYDALGKNGALGMMSLLMTVQFLMGVSILVAASRQSWAFSRDGALPFSNYFRHISKTMGFIPLRTTIGCAVSAAVLGLLCLIAPAAAAALFSLAVAGNNLAWGMKILSFVFIANFDTDAIRCTNLRSRCLGTAQVHTRAVLYRTILNPHRVDSYHFPGLWHPSLHVPGRWPRSNRRNYELYMCH